jgi:hypothetical protein
MCSRTAPCGGLLREVLVTETFTVRECVNGHSFRDGAPPPPDMGTRVAHYFSTRPAYEERRCAYTKCDLAFVPFTHRQIYCCQPCRVHAQDAKRQRPARARSSR